MRAAMALLVALLISTPALADHGLGVTASNDMAPTPQEVQSVILGLSAPGLTIHPMGESSEGRPIFVVHAVDLDSAVPMDERVHVFIMTQQHGNEPAGTPAALQLLQDLDSGAVKVAPNTVLLIMPQSNPDGALANQRTGAHGEDINRDHIDVGTPESLAIHAVLKRWDVHMAFDHHEYGGGTGGIGHPSPVGSYDYDITTMFPNHGNVRVPTRDMSLEVNDAIKDKLAAEGYTHGDYGMTTIRAGPIKQDLQQVAGGPDPGILRNSYGLNNVAGLLIESYVPPASAENPFQSFERRVASQRVVMDAVLEFSAANALDIIDAKRASERLNLEDPLQSYTEANGPQPQQAFFSVAEAHAASLDAHGLPAPAFQDGRHHHALAQERGGLIAALFHPDSSRAVEAAWMSDDATLPAEYFQHPDFGTEAPAETLDATPVDQSVPSLGVAFLLAGLVALVRRR